MFRYIGLLISFIIVSVILLVNPFGFSAETKNIIVPWATLALAFVAILTILNSNIREERIRKDRRLGDILDWAMDIIELTQVIKTPEPPSLTDETSTYEILNQKDKINSFNRVKVFGEHMKIVAFRVDKQLCAMVTNLVQAINDLLDEDWQSFDLNTTRYWLAEHEKRIYDITQDLVDDITKRLQRS